MTVDQWINLPAMMFVGLSLIIGLVVGKGCFRKSVLLIRDISITIGISGTLVSFVSFMIALTDVVMLRPTLSVALLPTIYGLMLYSIMQVLSSYLPEVQETEDDQKIKVKRGIIAISLLYMIPILVSIYLGIFTLYLHPTALIITIVFVLVPGVIDQTQYGNRSSLVSKCISIRQFSIYYMMIGLLVSWVGLLMSNGDPRQIGPQMAVAVLTILYSGYLHVSATIFYRSISDAEIPDQLAHQCSYLLVSLICLSSCLAQLWLSVWY